MKHKRVLIATLLLAISLTMFATPLIPVYAAPYERFSDGYLWISLFGKGKLEFSASEQTIIMHGFFTDEPWTDMTGEQKQEFLSTASFTLEINGVPVELKQLQWTEGGHRSIVFYAVFEPNTFEPGKYEFTGFWYYEADGVPLTLEASRKIVVT